jgi:AAA+ ATPase superfamily predicted ATPase
MTSVTPIPNPFVYGQVLLPGRPFCARPALESSVLQAAKNQQRVVLLGDRRMGKSSLVEHTLGTPDRILIPVDLRGLDSVEDFIDRLLLRLSTKLEEHRPIVKHLPLAFKEALSFVSDLRVNIHGVIEIQAKSKVKASTVIQVMDAVERASRWRPLAVFFDEFQEIPESLEDKPARHLLGVLRGEIQRHRQVAYLFAGSARGSMLELFTAESSHFYQSAQILEVGAIPQADMSLFLIEQFARGGRKLQADTLQAIFGLAGESPNDQQQLAYHLWTQSTPGLIGLPELQRAFATLMAEVNRRGEVILDEATSAQRRALFAIAVREDEEFARDSFVRFAGFTRHSSMDSAMRPFLKGNNAILEKRGSKVRYRERFMRLWVLLQVMRNPSMFPAARSLEKDADHALLLPYLADALK